MYAANDPALMPISNMINYIRHSVEVKTEREHHHAKGAQRFWKSASKFSQFECPAPASEKIVGIGRAISTTVALEGFLHLLHRVSEGLSKVTMTEKAGEDTMLAVCWLGKEKVEVSIRASQRRVWRPFSACLRPPEVDVAQRRRQYILLHLIW